MDTGIYEILTWGDPVGAGATAPRYCTIEGVAKVNSDGAAYAVPNEFICGRLGMMIGLPVPPGVIVPTEDGSGAAYVSLRFGPRGERPPPVIPEHLAEDNPHIAAGIVAFDCLIGNPDRHQENLAYIRNPKTPVSVFDHSHALLGTTAGQGIEHLRTRRELPYEGGCLAPHIGDGGGFGDWAARARGIQGQQLADLADGLVELGALTQQEAQETSEYLRFRASRLEALLRESAALAHMEQWGLS